MDTPTWKAKLPYRSRPNVLLRCILAFVVLTLIAIVYLQDAILHGMVTIENYLISQNCVTTSSYAADRISQTSPSKPQNGAALPATPKAFDCSHTCTADMGNGSYLHIRAASVEVWMDVTADETSSDPTSALYAYVCGYGQSICKR